MTKIKLHDKEERQSMKVGKESKAREAGKEGKKNEEAFVGRELKKY